MLNGNCPILPDNGRDVLQNLKIQVQDDSNIGSRQRKASPTHSCPGDRKMAYAKRRTQSSSDLDSQSVGGKPNPKSYRRRNSVAAPAAVAPDPRMNIISEDSSVKNGGFHFEEGSGEDDYESGVKLPHIKSEQNLMDISEISDISAHESILAAGFDTEAPVEDRVGLLENRMMDMAQSRKVMVDYISALQEEADSAKVERERAERAESMIEKQKAMLEEQKAMMIRLTAQVELARETAEQNGRDRDEVMMKTGINFSDLTGEEGEETPESNEEFGEEEGSIRVDAGAGIELKVEGMGSLRGSRCSGSESRTPPRRSVSPEDEGKQQRPVVGGRKIVSKGGREAFGDVGNEVKRERVVRKSSYPAGGRQAGLSKADRDKMGGKENDPFSLQGHAFGAASG